MITMGTMSGTPFSGRRLRLCEKQVLKRITTRAMSSCVAATISKSYRLISNAPEATLVRGRTVVVERTNGDPLRFTGADFSYGIGKDLDEAEFGLKSHKADRKA